MPRYKRVRQERKRIECSLDKSFIQEPLFHIQINKKSVCEQAALCLVYYAGLEPTDVVSLTEDNFNMQTPAYFIYKDKVYFLKGPLLEKIKNHFGAEQFKPFNCKIDSILASKAKRTWLFAINQVYSEVYV